MEAKTSSEPRDNNGKWYLLQIGLINPLPLGDGERSPIKRDDY